MEFMRFPDIKTRPPPVLLHDDIGPAAEITSESEVNMAFAKRPTIILMALLALTFSGGAASGAPAAFAAESTGPTQPIQAVRVDKIVSAEVGETREFWVSLPDGYSESGEKYPVLYMMDGEFNFSSGIIGGIRMAALQGQMPEFIVVGIKNTDCLLYTSDAADE